MTDIDNLEPLHTAMLELGRRFQAGDISRARRDARLSELSALVATLRRKRPRSPLAALPGALLPPVTFYSIDEAEAR